MSAQDYNTVRSLKLHEIPNNPRYKALVRQYAINYCHGPVKASLLKLAA